MFSTEYCSFFVCVNAAQNIPGARREEMCNRSYFLLAGRQELSGCKMDSMFSRRKFKVDIKRKWLETEDFLRKPWDIATSRG